jgi:hypothetical protein
VTWSTRLPEGTGPALVWTEKVSLNVQTPDVRQRPPTQQKASLWKSSTVPLWPAPTLVVVGAYEKLPWLPTQNSVRGEL